MTISRHRGLRLVGWVAAYVLALHTILASFLAVPSALASADGTVVLCLTGGTHGGDGGTDAPPSGASHCSACVIAGAALPPPDLPRHPVAYAVAVALHVPLALAIPSSTTARLPGLPRAPPVLA